MAKNNKKSWEQARLQGVNASLRFVKIAREQGYEIIQASRLEDINDHFDYKICKTGDCSKVEVKSAKKIKRSHMEITYDLVYVEFKNVNGKQGWLYGKADWVAFEQKSGFILIAATKLIEIAEKLVDRNAFEPYPRLYKSYRRKDRPDEHVGLIRIQDIMAEKHIIWDEIEEIKDVEF